MEQNHDEQESEYRISVLVEWCSLFDLCPWEVDLDNVLKKISE